MAAPAQSPIEVHDDPDAHPSRERTYVKVALVLALLTVAEVMTYVSPDLFGGKSSTALIVVLLLLMAVKFYLVGSFFMHLRFDSKVLGGVFYAGLTLAVIVYLMVLSAFRFFGPPASHMIPFS